MDIQNIAASFPNGEVPELLVKFYEFLDSNEDAEYLAYETIDDCRQYIETLINENVIGEFVPFYTDGRHNTYCIWNRPEGGNLADKPVAFFSTEGMHSVLAANLKDFFSVFTLGLELEVTSILHSIDYSKKMGWEPNIKDPRDFLTEKKLARIENYNACNYPDYLPFREWLANEMGIAPTEDAVTLVMTAYTTLPNLIAYIRSKDGFVIDPGS